MSGNRRVEQQPGPGARPGLVIVIQKLLTRFQDLLLIELNIRGDWRLEMRNRNMAEAGACLGLSTGSGLSAADLVHRLDGLGSFTSQLLISTEEVTLPPLLVPALRSPVIAIRNLGVLIFHAIN